MLGRVLLAAHCLAMSVTGDDPVHWSTSTRDGLSLVGLAPNRLDELNAKINAEVARIAAFIEGAAG